MDSAASTALVPQPLESERALESGPTRLQRIGAALKTAAMGTGRAAKWLASTAQEHAHYAPAVLNGAVGDKLARNTHDLAIPLSLRRDGRDVGPEAYDRALMMSRGHVVVFVHGLMADEVCWQRPFPETDGLATVLARDRGILPLYVRFNSGRHISENGRELAGLLERFVAPRRHRVRKLTLVGHSMGGLVVRSAKYYGARGGHAWSEALSSVVLLGAPHDGSYMEKVSHLAIRVLREVPTVHTQRIARLADERSDGIKDLRLGLLVDEDWQRPDADRMGMRDRTRVEPRHDIDYHVVAATLGRNQDSAVAAWFGDGLVGRNSATGRRAGLRPASLTVRTFPRTGHVGLLLNPDVHAYLSEVL